MPLMFFALMARAAATLLFAMLFTLRLRYAMLIRHCFG